MLLPDITQTVFLPLNNRSFLAYWEDPWFTPLTKYIYVYIFFLWRDNPQWSMASSFTRCLHHTQRHITVLRTPLHEWSARRGDLYL